MPAAVFVFRVHNPTQKEQEVSLAGLMMNPVGYDAAGRIEGQNHPNFGGNLNEPFSHGGAVGLELKAETGADPAIAGPVTIATLANLKGVAAPPHDWPEALRVEVLEQPPKPDLKLDDPAHTVIWLEEAPADLSSAWLKAARAAVEAGATLVFSGRSMPLLKSYAAVTGGKPLAQGTGRPDIVFEDFEHGYENWQVEGTAFGAKPATGTLPHQQPVSGFEGKGLVNSFLDGDDTIGRLISQPFTIERNFIRFLVGGGSFATTQIRLLVDGKTVRASAGRDNERLQPGYWDVERVPRQAGAPRDRGRAEGAVGSYQRRPDHVLRSARRSGHPGAARGASPRAVPRRGRQEFSEARGARPGRAGGLSAPRRGPVRASFAVFP